jgi:hypothetical protein
VLTSNLRIKHPQVANLLFSSLKLYCLQIFKLQNYEIKCILLKLEFETKTMVPVSRNSDEKRGRNGDFNERITRKEIRRQGASRRRREREREKKKMVGRLGGGLL